MLLSKRLIIALSIALCASAHAATIVVPAGNEIVEGESNNGFPFNAGDPQRYQQVYDSSVFGGMSGTIQQILFRVNSGYTSFGPTEFDLLVSLSHTLVTPGTLSTTFANNIGGDETTVLSGVVMLSGTGGGSPNPFDVVLDVDDLFVYNGTGNLLLDITVLSGSSGAQFDSVGVSGAGLIQRVWGNPGSPGNATGLISGDTGLVTAFVIDGGSSVPEPSTMLLSGLGILGLGWLRTRRRAS